MPNPIEYAKASEHSHQAALFMWANMACNYGKTAADDMLSYSVVNYAQTKLELYNDKIPQLKWLHAIHNQGHGDAVRGGKAKAEGVKAGVFDMFLPVPMPKIVAQRISMVQYGFYLELKVGKSQPSTKQVDFALDMTAAGYKCEVAVGWLEAREKILSYLRICC